MKNKSHFVVICGPEVERQERSKIIETILMIKGVEVAYEADNLEVKFIPDIDQLPLTVMASRLMARIGIQSVSQLLAKSEEELLCVPGFGEKTVDSIKKSLEEYGLKLREHNLRW